ncbi:hypothetical protein FACS189419_09460 [Planctomycetales bacterium]|nr:hypothetical protein FACS189419_09460 [Planctomycetales bacterium]
MKNVICLFALALAVTFTVDAVAEEKQDAAPEKATVVAVAPGCDCCAAPCGHPPVAGYRVGLFGGLRPVVYAPAPVPRPVVYAPVPVRPYYTYRPVYHPVRQFYPAYYAYPYCW